MPDVQPPSVKPAQAFRFTATGTLTAYSKQDAATQLNRALKRLGATEIGCGVAEVRE